jgi:hypothetical protein
VSDGAAHCVDVPCKLRFTIENVILLAAVHGGDVVLVDTKRLFGCELAFKWCESLG